MKRNLAVIAVIGSALLAVSPDALAHKKHHHGHAAYHDGDAYDGYHYQERHRPPRWLRRHDHFRAWYRHTPLKYNLRLGWDELYSIYIWERRYSPHKHFHRYGHKKAHRDYRFYRKYWKKHRGHRDWYGDRHHRDRYGDKRHRDRYGDRHHRKDSDRRYYRD